MSKEIGIQLTIGEDADGKTSVMVDFDITVEADAALAAAMGVLLKTAQDRDIDVARTLDPIALRVLRAGPRAAAGHLGELGSGRACNHVCYNCPYIRLKLN